MDNESEDRYSYGECRCCLERGHHREILEEYNFNGVREVYYDMFKETFNLLLSRSPVLPMLLCARCVARLRDARALRAQALDSERLLAARDQRLLFVDVPTEANPMDIKEEISVKLEQEDFEDYDVTELDDLVQDIQEKAQQTSELDTESELVPGEAALLARFPRVPRLPTRADLPHAFLQQLDMLQHTKIDSRAISVRTPSPSGALSSASEKAAHIANATVLLTHSNMTPFRSKHRRGFPCFYCRVAHTDFEELRKHTRLHGAEDLSRALRAASAESLVVYADVAALRCACGAPAASLAALRDHLRAAHRLAPHAGVTERVVPFLIQGDRYTCPLCSCKFVTFGSIERHMNGHYRNYVCKDCGSGFVTKSRLKVHQKSLHVAGSFPCADCGKVFPSQQKHKNHVNAVHRMLKRHACPACPARFVEYFSRQRHMVQAHGAPPLRYCCNVCEKTFDRRYSLSRHLKRDHLEERENECDICGYRCYTKNELKVHMVKHTGERTHECDVCRKSYARKKTLREHMRIHNNDRRFACPACGQAFVQKCSLKGHLKTHHFEYTLP